LERNVYKNFGGLPPELSNFKESRIAILPVPFDKTCTWIKGASKGPTAIINASVNLEFYDIDTDSEVYRLGIWTAPSIKARTSEKMVSAVYREVIRLLEMDKFVVVLGGEHTVALGSIKAHAEIYPNISILHLDAHADMRDTYEGNKLSHACVMARVREITHRTVSVGIRSMDRSERDIINRNRVFFAHEIAGSREWIEKVARLLTKNVYITIDLDVFDPSFMPSTGTPEPGGIGWYDMVDLMKLIFKKKNVVGFDVVELSPAQNPTADFTAAKLVYMLLSYKFFSDKIR